jgi:hydrogenase/urease accessory protein HupE
VGVSGALLGVVSTHLNEVEQWLRVSSAFVGLVVAVLTAFSLATGLGKAKRRRRHHREDEEHL